MRRADRQAGIAAGSAVGHTLHGIPTFSRSAHGAIAFGEYAFRAGAVAMSGTLTAKTVPHQRELRPGHHSAPFWLPYMDKSFAMHKASFAQ